MAGSGFDISNRYGNITTDDGSYVNRTEAEKALKALYEDKTTLSFTDMLGLMIAEFQNQTIDNQASTTDMMNQLVQMSSMQAMTAMVTQINELTLANVMNYAATLVEKHVTVCDGYDANGVPIEYYGKVIGTGTYGGQQVIFMDNNKMYYLSEIMAVGELPEKTQPPAASGDPDDEEEDIPTPPIEENENPDIDDDGNPIDTPTPPIEDSGVPDMTDDGEYIANSGATEEIQEEGLG